MADETTAPGQRYTESGRGIGSDFPLRPADLAGRCERDLEGLFGLPPGRWATFLSARVALKAVLQSEGLQPGDAVLVPSYLCPSILEPLTCLRLRPEFYRVDRKLDIDTDDITRRLNKGTKALVFIHYFGFSQHDDVLARLAELRGRVVLIEDSVQAMLTQRVGRCGGGGSDYSLASFRKFVPVPDGAWVRSSKALVLDRQAPSESPATAMRLAGMLLKGLHLDSLTSDERTYSRYMELLRAGERAFGDDCALRDCSAMSLQMMARQDWDAVRSKRRSNYARLAIQLRSVPGLAVLHADLPEGVCPLGLPVSLASRTARDTMRERLVQAGIYCAVHWQLPLEVKREVFPEAWELSERLLTLPIDQRYGQPDMDYIAARVKGVAEGTGTKDARKDRGGL